MTVAVVGAGIAGAACARALHGAGVDVQVLDRGRAPGGRMTSREIAGRQVDLGASYLTARDPSFGAVVEDWLERGLARPWTDTFHVATADGLGATKTGPLRYGAAGGLRSLVGDVLGGIAVSSGTTVRRVEPGPAGPELDGRPYDAVVLAMPDPQALRVLGPSSEQERGAVQDRAWEPVLVLAAGWEQRVWAPDFDGCFVDDGATDEGTGRLGLGWIADDGRRRGDGAPVLVAHSTSAVSSGTTVRRVEPGPAGPELDGRPYDAVVLAMPDPQALRVLGPSSEQERGAVQDRAWEPVLVLAAGWEQRVWAPDFDGCFVDDGDTDEGTGRLGLGWIADDGRRRGDGAPVLVAHSTSALRPGELAEPATAADRLLAGTRQVLGVRAEPAWTTVQRWGVARPVAPRDEPFHLGEALVGLCGDGWGSPRVETAWLSGHRLGQELAARLGS